MAIPAEILKKVKLLEIQTRKLVNSLFAGQYHSAFKGQGMTFSEFREYVAGDDVRTISWPVTARTGKTHIKKYDEEREQTLFLLVDVSGSTVFGSQKYFKGEVMTHLSALLGFAAAKNNDNVGLLLYSNQVEHFVPPKKGRPHIQRILRDLYYHQPKRRGTNLAVAAEYVQGLLKKRAHIFVFSDFLDQGFATALRSLGRKHEVIAVVVQDPLEKSLPDVGLLDLEDAETGERITVDTSSKSFRRAYEGEVKRLLETREAEFRKANVDRVEVLNNDDFVDPLIAYFRRRVARR